MKNAILIDFDPNPRWNFDGVLKKETTQEWEVIKKVSNLNQGNLLQIFIRYIKYFCFPFGILLRRKQYGKLIAWQQFYGIVYAFYTQLFRIKNGPDLYIMTFIYKEKESIWGMIYRKFISYSLKSKFIKRIFVFSSSEPQYYSDRLGFNVDKFTYIRLGVEDCYFTQENQSIDNNKFYLSVGRSNRDYDFLVQHWNTAWGKLKIITDMNVTIPKNSTNIEIIRNCYENDYYKYLSKCYAVIIPLNDENISSGELAVIQAGMFGKPVIVTYNKTLKNYIVEGENGFLINKYDIEKYINILKDENLYKKMCLLSRKNFEKKHSLMSMAREISRFIE